MKTCPSCAEEVKDEAATCRFCGHDFTGQRAKAARSLYRYAVVIGFLLIVLVLVLTKQHQDNDSDDVRACLRMAQTAEEIEACTS